MQDSECTSTAKKPIRVWVDGCFDVTHFGHANALRKAKALGNILVVGIHGDEEILKNKGVVVYPFEERYRLIRAMKWVDEIVEDSPFSIDVAFLDKYNCDFCTHGTLEKRCHHDRQTIALLPIPHNREFGRTEGISTTHIVQRLLDKIDQMRLDGDGVEPSQSLPLPQLSPDQRRRSRSLESLTAFPPTDLDAEFNNSQSAAPKGDDEPTKFDWATCGQLYMPNILSINQFSGSSLGLQAPKPDDVVVYAPGTFDLFHVGHLSFLEKCLELGTYLIIGLHSDKYVNNVVLEAPYVIPASLLDHFKVNYVAIGLETKICPDASGRDPMKVPRERKILRILDSGSKITTTSIIQRIFAKRSAYVDRNRNKLEKEARVIATLFSDSSTAATSSQPQSCVENGHVDS